MTEAAGREPMIVQNVTAVNGFAYGVIGADVHVLGNGVPLYLLANWRTAPAARPGWLRELPSRMLNAQRAIVPFTGRTSELAQLRLWRDSGVRLAVRWLHGPGGQGKTRLAAQFAAESVAAGWKVVSAFHGPDADPVSPGSQDVRPEGTAGLLVIVDYADRWLLTNLTWLLKNALMHQAGTATRVLMVARTADAWPRVRAVLDTHQADTSSQHLPGLNQESDERSSMFTAAVKSFSAIYQLPGTQAISLPGLLEDPEFGLTLAVHMAALAAVDAWATGQRPPPSGTAALTMYLLDREQLHWARLYADGAADAATADHSYRTPPDVMNQAVFTAVLTGAVTHTHGATLLERLRLPDPEQVLEDHTACYPPADPGSPTVLEPLYPDRLAEDFLALTMPGHRAAYPAQAWAADTTTTLLARHSDPKTPAAWTPRAITFLASAAQRWPHLGQDYLYPLLRRDPQLAVDAGSAALTVIADLPGVTDAALAAIERSLPPGPHVDLDTGSAAIATRLARHRLAATDDPARRADVLDTLAFRLSAAGTYEQAVAASQEAVELRRQLPRRSRLVSEKDFALSLNILGICLSDLGRYEEALSASSEAVEIRRRLARANPFVRIFRRLARAEPPELDFPAYLINLAVDLFNVGRADEALAVSEEALDITRWLARKNPAATQSDLARVLTNKSQIMLALGREQESYAASAEAAQVNRQLAQASPAMDEPQLAWSLTAHSGILSAVDHAEEALAASEEAVETSRRHARANPARYEPALARALTNKSKFVSELGREAEDALAASAEAAQIMRRLADANPAVHEAEFARSLNALAQDLSAAGHAEEAVATGEEAVAIKRHLARDDPTAHEAELAMAFSNLGTYLCAVGRLEDALAAASEAAEIQRRLARANPDAHDDDLAQSLADLLEFSSEQGRWDLTRSASTEVAGILRQPTQAVHESGLGQARDGSDIASRTANQAAAAEPTTLEAEETRRRPVRADNTTRESGRGSQEDTTGRPSISGKLNLAAKRVVFLAKEEAKTFHHDYIGTEHLLLGLLQVESAAARTLQSLDINAETARERIKEIVGPGQDRISGHISLSLRAKRTLEFSLTEAQELGHDYIGAEHLLLGLINDGEGVAVQILMEMGADMPGIRERVSRELDLPDSTGVPPYSK
jgi:tetratricopeptide (TPR) repeat protein